MNFKNTSSTMTLRGVEFPKGKSVKVDDPSLIAKCLNIAELEQVADKPKAKKNVKNKD